MTPNFKVLFVLAAPSGCLTEIQRLDQPEDAPKAQVFHWLWIQSSRVTRLHFQEMRTTPVQVREFTEGSLAFDAQHGTLRWTDGSTEMLVVQPDKQLTPAIAALIDAHLRNAPAR